MNETGLGKALQDARKSKGLTQQQLCQLTGLSYSTLAKIERGAIKSPSIFTVTLITNALSVSLDSIMGDTLPAKSIPEKRTAQNGVKFVYFDINGCLINFYFQVFSEIAEDTGANSDHVEQLFWRYNDPACRGEISLSEFNKTMAKELKVLNFDWQHYYQKTVQPIEISQKYIQEVAKDFRIGLLSNIMNGQINALIDNGKLPDLKYDVIIDSSVVKSAKPDPEIYKIANERAGVKPEEILFVDDSRANLASASKMGWHTLWFNPYEPEESVQKVQKALV